MTDPISIANQWRDRGFSFGVWEDAPEMSWEDLRHAYDELFMIAEGEMELVIDGEAFRPKPGEEILIPAGALRSKRSIGRRHVRWYFGYRDSCGQSKSNQAIGQNSDESVPIVGVL